MVNKKLFSVILATLVTLSIVGGASVAFAQTAVVTTQKTTIVTTAETTPTLADLVKALNATNLTTTLNDTTKNFTVFAPNDAAFGALGNTTLSDLLTNNTTKLSTILLSHVVSGRVNLAQSGNATTLAGDTISWNATNKTVQIVGGTNATFVGAPVNTSNGQVQVINAVLIPPPSVTSTATASATASGGFLGLPGFEIFPAVVGLLAVAYLVMRRRQ